MSNGVDFIGMVIGKHAQFVAYTFPWSDNIDVEKKGNDKYFVYGTSKYTVDGDKNLFKGDVDFSEIPANGDFSSDDYYRWDNDDLFDKCCKYEYYSLASKSKVFDCEIIMMEMRWDGYYSYYFTHCKDGVIIEYDTVDKREAMAFRKKHFAPFYKR